jgi:hypothetical protein
MLGVLQSHFEVAGGRVSFLSWAFGLILIYAARKHFNPRFRSLLRSFQQDCGTPASAA